MVFENAGLAKDSDYPLINPHNPPNTIILTHTNKGAITKNNAIIRLIGKDVFTCTLFFGISGLLQNMLRF